MRDGREKGLWMLQVEKGRLLARGRSRSEKVLLIRSCSHLLPSPCQFKELKRMQALQGRPSASASTLCSA